MGHAPILTDETTESQKWDVEGAFCPGPSRNCPMDYKPQVRHIPPRGPGRRGQAVPTLANNLSTVPQFFKIWEQTPPISRPWPRPFGSRDSHGEGSARRLEWIQWLSSCFSPFPKS